MERIILVALFALAWTKKTHGVRYIFQEAMIEMVEVSGMDMDYSIRISRAEDADLTMPRTLTLTTNCPAGVTTTASSSDYSVASSTSTPLQVIFPPFMTVQTVMVTIAGDTDVAYESREVFCLSIPEDMAGSQDKITVIIPENDFCYEKSIPGIAMDYGLVNAIYVGPWTPTSISNTVDITVTPQIGTDIIIFLATDTARGTGTNFYSIVFDDSAILGAPYANAAVAAVGDTSLFRGGVVTGTHLATLAASNGVNADDNVLMDGMPYSFWLRYIQGKIDIGLQSARGTVSYSYMDSMTPVWEIKHIYVQSSAIGPQAATFEICHLSPIKLRPVGAVQYVSGGNPDRAIDGGIGPAFTTNQCFVSSPGSNPWLRIDLGKVYEVTNLLIWPVTTEANFNANSDDIATATVYVGNCPSGSVTLNTQCFMVGIAPVMGDPIEGDCQTTAYGRYVYIYKTGTTQFSFCEVEIYGKEVPYSQDTTVQFQLAEYEVNENDGTLMINAFRTYPMGVSPSCTLADYYTDRTVTPVSGNSNDFMPIPANPTDANPSIPLWAPGDASGTGTLQPIMITINDDNPGVCEPVETFNVYLTNLVGGIAGTPSSTTVRIVDTDTVNYSFSMASYPAIEGDSFRIAVTRSGNAAMQQGTAGLIYADVTTTSSDYTSTPPTSIQFNSDTVLTVPADVLTTEDEIYEPTESLTVTLGALTPNENGCSTIGTTGMATLIITDDDSRFNFNVPVDATTIVIPEGQSRTIEITRDGYAQQKDVEIVIYEGGTDQADLGNDFSITPAAVASTPPVSTVTFNAGSTGAKEITINTENDSDLEGVETFTLTLRDPLYPQGNRADPYSLTISIVDNDAQYFWKQNSYTVTEGTASVIVCLIRTGTSEQKTITITTEGVSALAGSDFTPITRIEFGAGLYEACTPVQIAVDTATESTETFTMKITSEQDVVTNSMTDTTTVSISDDDTIISFSQATYSFMEGQSGLSVMISKTGNPSVSFTLTITSRTATQNNDFILNVGSSSSLTIPMGTTSLTLPITIIDDGLVEQAEQFTLTISGASGGTISTPTATITITDNDMATPITPITTPTTPDQGIGGPAIAAIVVAASIGAIITIIAIVIFFVMLRGASAAVPTAASAAAAANIFPLTNYPSAYDNAPNGYDNGFGGYNPSPYYM